VLRQASGEEVRLFFPVTGSRPRGQRALRSIPSKPGMDLCDAKYTVRVRPGLVMEGDLPNARYCTARRSGLSKRKYSVAAKLRRSRDAI